MKYRNIDVVQIVTFLDKISERKLPQKINYAIMRNLDSFQKENQFYEKSLNKIIESYKDFLLKDPDGNLVISKIGIPTVDENHIEDYNNEISELISLEVDVKIYQVPESIFDYEDSNGKYDTLSGSEILKLVKIFGKTDEDKTE